MDVFDWLDKANWLKMPLTLLYIFCMVIYPWWDGNGNWDHVQRVWYSWQSFNAGVLLFISAIVTLKTTKYIHDKKREADLIAAKAFLPEALSELSSYCAKSARLLKEAYAQFPIKNGKEIIFKENIPELPSHYKKIFARCIALEKKVNESKYLAFILMRLQVINSRNHSLKSDFFENALQSNTLYESRKSIVSHNIISYILDLGELKALIDRSFNYARGYEDVIDSNKLTWTEYYTAYQLLEIDPESYDDLKNHTQNIIERTSDVYSIKSL